MELIRRIAVDVSGDSADVTNRCSCRMSDEVLRIDTECYRHIFQVITQYASLPKNERRNPIFDRVRTGFLRLFGWRDMPKGEGITHICRIGRNDAFGRRRWTNKSPRSFDLNP